MKRIPFQCSILHGALAVTLRAPVEAAGHIYLSSGTGQLNMKDWLMGIREVC